MNLYNLFFSVSLIKVDCSPSQMRIEVTPPYDSTKVYLEHLKSYPGKHCKNKVIKDVMGFDDFKLCVSIWFNNFFPKCLRCKHKAKTFNGSSRGEI